jgi:hypothetical protein
VSLSLKELREWVPEIGDLARATRDRATNHGNSAEFYRDVVKASTWQGVSAQAAMTSMLMAAAAHDVKAEDMSTAASAMDRAEQDAAKLANTVKVILDDAAESPEVEVDQATNQVSAPSNYDYLDDETKTKVSEKIADVKARITDAVAEGDRIDGDLARAIAQATGTPPPSKPATSLGDLMGVPGGAGPPQLSESRRRAVEHADKWAGDEHDPHRGNPDFENFGDGGGDCTNFASQVMRAGGFNHAGDPVDDAFGNPNNHWFYENSLAGIPGIDRLDRSKSWAVAQANRDFVVNSGRGQVVGASPMPSRDALDPLAPSKAGLVPGDLIYYHDNATGTINHTAVYVGQEVQGGKLVDVVDQHAWGSNNYRNDWMPDHPGFTGGPASVEFVHLHYPGD